MTIDYKKYLMLQEQLTECITEKNLPQIQKQVDKIVSSFDNILSNLQKHIKISFETYSKEYLFEPSTFEQFILKEKEDIINTLKFDLNPILSLLEDKIPQLNIYKINKTLDGLYIEMTDLFIKNMNKIATELIEKHTANSVFNIKSNTAPNIVSFYNSKNDVLASISNDGIFTFKADVNDQNTKDFLKCIETLGVKITGMQLT